MRSSFYSATTGRGWRRVFGALVLFVFIPSVHAADLCDRVVGHVANAEGNVEVQRGADTRWQAAKLKDPLCEGDSIRAAERSRATIALANQAVLRIDQNSTLRLINIGSKPGERSLLKLFQGAVQSFSRKPSHLEVSTPYLNGTIEGTEFVIRVAENQTVLTVFEGKVRAANEQGAVAVPSGQSVAAEAGKAPQLRAIVRARDAAQWSLYYPPVLSGDQGLQQVAQDLSVGRVAEARAGIDKALTANPNNGLALALRSVIHTVQNNRTEAMADAQKAVAASPDVTASWIALSYAQQSGGDIAGARASLSKAVEKQPGDALAWARLAELELMMGERKRSAKAADTAVQLAPNLSRAYMARGFAALTERRIADASTAFEKAISLDSADPLPHLGLGIARINSGSLENGRRELELAVAMDSNSALFRAYLGKAYFEEKRRDIDAQQLTIAKEMDPQDPTAYFYNAIRLQTENQPVDALSEVNASIERNDNRAVYRSRLLLDSDEAARSAGLARVYNDLGFQQLALVEGWKSVNTDPTDSSAHRFLADSYSSLPRHEIARVSELLQSQLLAPVSNTPLSPRAGESNLGLISSGGPGAASYNEYSSLFNRNGVSVLVSGMGAEQGTAGGDVVVAGMYGNVGISVGYSGFTTDGFRVNADQEDRIGNMFFQYDLSPDTSVQAEYRRRTNEWGDTKQKFFTDAFSSSLRNTVESDTYRLGFRHTFSPGSTLLGSLVHQLRDTKATFSLFPPDFVLMNPGVDIAVTLPDESASSAELQHLYRSDRFNLRSGVGYFKVDRTEVVDATLVIPIAPPDITVSVPAGPSAITDAQTKHLNAYVYDTLLLAGNVKAILGASFDSVDGKLDSDDKSQFNPKLGLIWNVTPATTVRAAAFRALKRSLITDQTLEPTEVAGFNQFYDDPNLTESRRYGAAVDQKFSSSTFGGIELSKRELIVPWTCVSSCAPVGPRESDWKESQVRAYAFWAPHPWWALRTEYIFEQFERDPEFTLNAARELDSHRVPIGLRFFHPSGFGAALTGTYWKQKGEFGDGGFFLPGNEKFWTVDAALSYRLPRRIGFITAGATNLLGKEFRYLDTDERNPTIQPMRIGFVRMTLVFP